MAVAHDVATQTAALSTASTQNTTHTPVGTPRGVLILIVQNAIATDQISGITYGGVAVPRSYFLNAGAISEPGCLYAYFLGKGLPTGAQTVAITSTGTAVKRATIYTVTAATDTILDQCYQSATSTGLPTFTTVASSYASMLYASCLSGLASPDATVKAGTTLSFSHDYGAQSAMWWHRSLAAATTVAVGGTSATSDDVAILGAQITELRSSTGLQPAIKTLNPLLWMPFDDTSSATHYPMDVCFDVIATAPVPAGGSSWTRGSTGLATGSSVAMTLATPSETFGAYWEGADGAKLVPIRGFVGEPLWATLCIKFTSLRTTDGNSVLFGQQAAGGWQLIMKRISGSWYLCLDTAVSATIVFTPTGTASLGADSKQLRVPWTPVAGTTYQIFFRMQNGVLDFFINGVNLGGGATYTGGFSPTGSGFIVHSSVGSTSISAVFDELAVGSSVPTDLQIQDLATAAGLFVAGTTFNDSRSGTVTASGTGSETFAHSNTSTGTVTASGTGTESYASADSNSGTVTAGGSKTESYSYADSSVGTVTATGSGIESYVSAYAAIILADSPAGYWHLNDLTDSSGNGLTLTQTGTVTDVASLVVGGESGAKQFLTDFNADSLRRADEALVRHSATFTVEAWVKPAYVGDTDFFAVQKYHQYHLYQQPNGTFRVMFYTSSGFFYTDSVTIAVAGTTYHIAGVLDNEVAKIYVDGVLESSAPSPGTPVVNTNAFVIGSDPGVNQGWWGVVDEAAIYQTALSSTKIQDRHAAGSGNVIYRDSGSGTITASGTGTDARVYTDSGSGTVTASGTGTDARVYSDTGTGTIVVTGTGTDSSVYADIGSGTITASGTGSDTSVYNDSGSGTVTASGAGTDARVYTDSNVGTISVTGTGTDAVSNADVATGTVTAAGTSTESASHAASATGTVIASGTRAEAASHDASATGTIAVTGTGIDSQVYDDARSGTILASGSGVDSYAILVGYVDAASGQITVNGTGVESQSHTSTAIGSVSASGTSVESQSHTSTATGSVSASGTSVESQSYTDTATGSMFVDGTGTETYGVDTSITYTDASAGIITSTGTGIDSVSYDNTTTGTITSTGTGVDSVFYDNTVAGTVTLIGSSVESRSYTDASTGTIVVTGIASETGVYIQPVPFSTVIALNRTNIAVWNNVPIRSVVTSTALLSVQVALQRTIKVDVTKRNGTKVLVRNR